MSLSMAADRLWMPIALTLSSMPLTSTDFWAPRPVIRRICSCTLPTETWPTAATATTSTSTSMHPNPSPSRVEMDRDFNDVVACMAFLV